MGTFLTVDVKKGIQPWGLMDTVPIVESDVLSSNAFKEEGGFLACLSTPPT